MLIMQGGDDETVRPENSFTKFEEACADKKNVEFVLYENKGHDIIKSEESAAFNKQLDEDLQAFADKHGGKMNDSLWGEFLSGSGLKKAAEPDAKVVRDILNFLDD